MKKLSPMPISCNNQGFGRCKVRDEPGLGPGSSFPLQGGNKKPPYWAPFVTYGGGWEIVPDFREGSRSRMEEIGGFRSKYGPPNNGMSDSSIRQLSGTAQSDSSIGQINLTDQSDSFV